MADHSPHWTDAVCADGRYRDVSRYYAFADGRAFVLPMVARVRTASRGWLMSPPPAWGFGGLVGAGLDRAVVGAVLEDLASLRALRISIRPDPLHAGAWAGGAASVSVTRVPRYAHVVDLGAGHEAVGRAFSKSARRGVRQAVKAGVTIRTGHTGALLDEHYALHLSSVQRWAVRQREPLALARWRASRRDPLTKLEAMARCLGPAFCRHVAYHDGRPVASAIVLLGSSAHDTRGAMDRDLAAPVKANDLLQAHALHHAIGHGCRFYHLGESAGSSSLAHFKEKFGARGYAYTEIRMERLPLTSADAFARGAVKRAIGFRDA